MTPDLPAGESLEIAPADDFEIKPRATITETVWEGRRAILKEMPRTQNSEREVAILRRLQGHRNIIPLLHWEADAKSIRMIMPRMPASLLELASSATEGLPSRMFINMAAQLIEVVRFMHDRRIVHKDIKLENILVNAEGQLFLIDFGFAREFSPEERTLQDSLGSLHYAAPELWEGDYYFGPEVDIWALGVVLYTLASGYFPFNGDSAEEIYRSIVNADIATPPLLKWLPHMQHLLKRMLDLDADRRLTLDEVLGQELHLHRLASPQPRRRPHKRAAHLFQLKGAVGPSRLGLSNHSPLAP